MEHLEGLGRFPIVTLGVLLFMLATGATLLGIGLHRMVAHARTRRTSEDEAATEILGPVVSSILGLLALLLGFTFALAVDRYETRRSLVLEEANAIGSAYLQAQLLPPADRERVSRLLATYADNRVTLGRLDRETNPDLRAATLRRNDALITDLWAATVAAFDNIRPPSFVGTFVQTMNLVIDLDTSRKTSRMARVPNEVFIGLLAYVLISALVLGYVTRTKTAFGFTCVLHVLVSLALLLIVDIDRPRLGGIQESQEPMLMLQRTMHDQPPATFDRWRREPSRQSESPAP